MRKLLKQLLLASLCILLIAELGLHAAAWVTQHYYKQGPLTLIDTKVRILCVGDSNTYGLYLPPESSWPSQLQAILDERAPGRYQIINLGYPGTPTHRIAESIPGWVQDLSPDKVIMLAGVNDVLYGPVEAKPVNASRFMKARRFLVDHVRLYRLWQLAKKNFFSAPAIKNDSDVVMASLSELRTLPDNILYERVANLYRTLFDIDSLTVIFRDGQYWLHFQQNEVSLTPTSIQFKTADSYEQIRILVEPLKEVGVNWRDIVIRGGITVNRQTYALDLSQAQTDAHAGEDNPVVSNIAFINTLLNKSDTELLLLTYGSGESFYGQANTLTQKAAMENGIPLLDIASQLAAICPPGTCGELFFPDQHPNAEGYRHMAEIIARHILTSNSTTPANVP